MKESTMVLWVFFFLGGGGPRGNRDLIPALHVRQLNQQSEKSGLSAEHTTSQWFAFGREKKKKKPKKHFRLITLANQTLPLHAHILLLSHNFFSLSHEYYLREERERAPPRFCQQ